MKAQAYLSRAYRLDGRINSKMEQLMHLRSLAYRVTSAIREDKVTGSGSEKSTMETAVVKIVDAEQRINEEIERLIGTKAEIADMISLMSDEDERLLLELRYLCFNTWEQIAVKMHIGIASAYRIHQRALGSFESMLAVQRRTSGGKIS
jgi:DNA-directed RNA polymerase specialized sigma subunit